MKMTKTIILSWFLAVILAGCSASPGSLGTLIVEKNIYVLDSDEIKVEYTTQSNQEVIQEMIQDFKDLLDLSIEPKIK